MARLLIILFLFIAQASLVQGQPYVTHLSKDSLTNSYSFEENWLYHAGDDSAWAAPGYNDSNWRPLDSRLRLQDSANIYFKGIGWFRLHISVDSSLRKIPLALMLEHDGASEIYIDGRRVTRYGRLVPRDSVEYHNPKSLPYVISALDSGNHVIAVRYANYFAKNGWDAYEGYMAGFALNIYAANIAFSSWSSERNFMGLFLLTMGGFFVALSLLHFLLWMYDRKDRSNLYFCILCFSACLAFFIPYVSTLLHNPRWTQVFAHSSIGIAVLIAISLSGVTNKFFGRSRLRFRIIAILGLAPFALSFFRMEVSIFSLVVVCLFVTLESIIVTISAIYRKVPGARIVGVGILFLTLFVFTIVSIAVLNKGLQLHGGWLSLLVLILCIAAILSIPVSMSIYLASNFTRIAKDLKHQLVQVQTLSEKTMAQEQEKQRYLETEKDRLEEEVTMRTAEIVSEKQKSDDLLRNILPEEVANELKQKGSSEAKYFDHVTVIFTDFVDFTKAGERLTPQQLVDELHTCFKAFDDIISKYHIEKIKTIGDAYLAVSGLPAADHNHAENTVRAALDIKAFMNERKKRLHGTTFDIRIGLHSGAVVAGIVGVKKFAYDIWGDTVNTAARMEQSSLPDKINISQTTYELIKDKFICTYRGEIAAKNKGDMNMYFVEGLKEGI